MEEKSSDTGLRSEVLKSTDGYREGAIAGSLVGIVIAAYLRKNIVIGAVMGMVVGGYVMYAAKKDSDTPTFMKQ